MVGFWLGLRERERERERDDDDDDEWYSLREVRNRESHKKWSVVDVYLIEVTTGVRKHVWGLVLDGYCLSSRYFLSFFLNDDMILLLLRSSGSAFQIFV